MVCGCQGILSLLAGVVVQFQIRSHFSFHKLLSLILCLFLVLFFFCCEYFECEMVWAFHLASCEWVCSQSPDFLVPHVLQSDS